MEAAAVVIPIDADPRLIALFVARDGAIVVLEAAKLALPPLPDIPGEFVGKINLQLGTRGLSGQVRGEYCDQQCTALAGGRLSLLPQPQACIAIPLLGDVCTPI